MNDKVLRVFVADPKRDIQTLEYYRLNKIYMRIIGRWPFSPLWQQRLGLCIVLIGIGSLYSLEIIHFLESLRDIDEVIDSFAPIMINTASFIKLTTLIIAGKAVRELFTRMQNDWNTRTDEAEIKILEKYANNSKALTFNYTIYMYVALFAYLSMPTMPIVLNKIKPLNESRPKELPSHAEYFIDEPTEHYIPIFVHQTIGTLCSVTSHVICDTMYVTYVQHACGIFATLNHRLETLVDEDERHEDFNTRKEDSRIFVKIANCIEEHQRAIKFAEFIENTYCIPNLLQITINMLVISVTGFQTAMNLDKLDVVVRFGTFTIAELNHLFYTSMPGQALHDHSTKVFYAAYNCKWYSMSKASRDLLKLIMVRSLIPCQLTAGKLWVMDLERFSAALQTSMSYFTVLTSMR